MNTGESELSVDEHFSKISPFRRAFRVCSCSWRGEKRSENQNFSLQYPVATQPTALSSTNTAKAPPVPAFSRAAEYMRGEHHAFFINAERVERQQDKQKKTAKNNPSESLANTLSLSSTSIRVVSVAASIRKNIALHFLFSKCKRRLG